MLEPTDKVRGESFERVRAALSSMFLNLPAEQIDSHIVAALGRIAVFLGVERATLYELSETGTEMTATAWGLNEARPLPRISRAENPERWALLIERAGVLFAADPAALPEVWAASVPLKIGGRAIGAIRVASTTRQLVWTDDLCGHLSALAEIFSNAVTRRQVGSALLQSGEELRKARALARQHEERFNLVADTTPVLIWMLDTTRLATYFNRPWLDFVGRSIAKELGNGWATGVHADDRAGCLAGYAGAFDRRERFTVQYRLRRHDGEYRWVLATGVPRFDQHGAFDGYIGSCIDVTNEKLAEEALAALGGRLMEAQEQERSRIARELHDDICQRLAVLAIGLQQLNGVESVADIHARSEELFNRTVDISSHVQALSHQLHSSKLEYLGIVAAIRGFCGEFARQPGQVTIDFTSSGVPTHLPRDVSLCLFRVVQEGLRNAVNHSGVRHVEAQLLGTSTMVVLTIRDRGRGFEPEVAMHGHGLGLISMRERANLVGGTILVTSKPGWGTEISIRIPIEGNPDRRARTAGTTRHASPVPSDRASQHGSQPR